MDNGLYHIEDNKIYKMSLNEPMKQVGTVMNNEAINMDKINQIKKEIFASMKMMDTTIKGVKESKEYKIAQAYNQGLRDAMAIFEREMKQ